MLRLPSFDVVSPDTIDGVLEALATPGARIVAGGTDLLPNLKHRMEAPALLVSLHRLGELKRISLDEAEGRVRIGAGVSLTELSENEDVRRLLPSLAEAAGQVAGPQIRNAATLGGNVNLDTRCRYVNQTSFWRGAIGGCLKAEGQVCHVVAKGRRCVAAISSDCAPALISLDAEIVLRGASGERVLPLADYYHADGVRHTHREEGELTTEIRVPVPGPRRSCYVKWRVRDSIDFPLVSVALRFDLDAEGKGAKITGQKVVVGVLGSKPRVVRDLDGIVGSALSTSVAETVAAAAHKQCKPLENVPYEAQHRRHLIRVLTRRGVLRLAAE